MDSHRVRGEPLPAASLPRVVIDEVSKWDEHPEAR